MGRILIVADNDAVCSATPRGLELAHKMGKQADVVAVCYTSFKPLKLNAAERVKLKKRILKEREKRTRALIDKYRARGQKVSLRVVWDKDAVGWIIRQCAHSRYAVVVKTGGQTDARVHSAADWQLLRECQSQVLLVAEKKWHRTKPVLAALDLSSTTARKRALNRKVLGVAKLWASALQVELEVITAVEIPTLLTDLDLIDPLAYVRSAKEDMQPEIKKLAVEFDVPVSAFECKRGPVAKVITSRAAKVRAQVAVMGTVAHTGVKARLLGNTAEEVLRHMHTDVLAIKP